MVVDHVADVFFELTIQSSTWRTLTRLSMPLFCLLMGYFFRPDRPVRLTRSLQIAAAAIAVNLVFYPRYERIEILGSLLIAYLLFLAMRHLFSLMVLAIVFYPIDPLAHWLDFPITIVVSFVAQGMLIRRNGIPLSIMTAGLLTIAGLWIHDLEPMGVNHKLCFFALPATCLVMLASHAGSSHAGSTRQKQSTTRWLAPWVLLGQNPLAAYVAQYYLIFGVDALLARMSV